MLLPSALSCDSSQPRLQSALFISPPTSPHQMSTQSAIGNLINSCRNLHSLIASPSANSHLPSPPLANVASPLVRPRLRRREAAAKSTTPSTTTTTTMTTTTTTNQQQTELPRYRIKKRVAPPRGANKRRRTVDDDLGRSDQEDSTTTVEFQNENINIFDDNDKKPENGIFIFKGAERNVERSPLAAPSTPKRQRIAPPDVPRGLTKEDFHKIGASPQLATQKNNNASSLQGTNVEVNKKGDAWSLEDDSKLVEIVLEKVKNMDLSKEVWEDCVRNLPGKDYSSVSTRWRSLLKSERIGLQNRGRRNRGKLHGTW